MTTRSSRVADVRVMQEVGCEKSPIDAIEERGERLTLERMGNEMNWCSDPAALSPLIF